MLSPCQGLLPMMSLIEQSKMAVDELIAEVGRASLPIGV
jgi:hypothetical protein